MANLLEGAHRGPGYSSIEEFNADMAQLRKFGDAVSEIVGIPGIVRHRAANPGLYSPHAGSPVYAASMSPLERTTWELRQQRSGNVTEVYTNFLADDLTAIRCFIYADSTLNNPHWAIANLDWQREGVGIEFVRHGMWDSIYMKQDLPHDLLIRLFGVLDEALDPGSAPNDESEQIRRVGSMKMKKALSVQSFLSDPMKLIEGYRGTQSTVDRLATLVEFREYIETLDMLRVSEPNGIVLGTPGYGSYCSIVVDRNDQFVHVYNPHGVFVRSTPIDSDLQPNPYFSEISIPVVVEKYGSPVGGICLNRAKVLHGDKATENIAFTYISNERYWIRRWETYGSAYSSALLKR